MSKFVNVRNQKNNQTYSQIRSKKEQTNKHPSSIIVNYDGWCVVSEVT